MSKSKTWAILILLSLLILLEIFILWDAVSTKQIFVILVSVNIILWAIYGIIYQIKKLKRKNISIVEYDKELNINFSTKILYKDYLKLSFELLFKRPHIYFMLNVAFFIIISSLTNDEISNSNFYLFYGLVVIFPIFYLFITFRSAKQIFSTNKSLNENLTYQIKNDSLYIKSETSEGTTLWTRFIKIQETKNFFLCYADKIVATFIYKKAFKENELIEFREFLKSLPVTIKIQSK